MQGVTIQNTACVKPLYLVLVTNTDSRNRTS